MNGAATSGSNDGRGLPQFPGAVGLTRLRAYSWDAQDGMPGGSPHMHLACAECYCVIAGSGRLQTMTVDGVREVPLTVGDVIWFTPGTIHRTINDDGALQVIVVMQNGGLPESGDAVLTFPPGYLIDAETYARTVSLAGPDGTPTAERSRARRDLAVQGFTELRSRWDAGDHAALDEFYAAATALVKPKLGIWRERLSEGAVAEARNTSDVIDALAEGRFDHLKASAVARIEQPGAETFGMCGMLRAYDPVRTGQ